MTTRGDGARNNLARRLDVLERERERETTGKSAFFLPEFSRLTLSHRTLTECISNEYREKFLTSALSLSLLPSRCNVPPRLAKMTTTLPRFEKV